jgi:hypothetical protein
MPFTRSSASAAFASTAGWAAIGDEGGILNLFSRGASDEPSSGLIARVWPAVLIVAVAAALLWRTLFAGQILLPADTLLVMLPWKLYAAERFPHFRGAYNGLLDPIQQYYPWRLYAVESVRSGFLPLWNPYSFSGSPFLANLQSTILYPPNLLFLLIPVARGFAYSAFLHLCLAGLGAFGLLRLLGLRQVSALLGGLVFMLNGYFIAWLEFPAFSYWVLAWLPLLLLFTELTVRSGRGRYAALTGLVFALQFLGGQLQISVYLVLAAALYAGVRAAAQRGRRPTPLFVAGQFLAAVGIGAVIAAAQLLPTWELATQSARPLGGPALSTALPITHLATYFIPNFYGNPVDANYWGDIRGQYSINFIETCGYVGALALLLAFVGLRAWERPAGKYFALLTLLSLLVALGTPVANLLYLGVPGFRQLAGLSRIISLTAFGLAGLAALGAEELLERPRRITAACAAFAVVGLGLVCFGLALYGAALAPEFQAYLRWQFIVGGAFGVLSLLVVALRGARRLPAGWFGLAATVLVIGDLFVFGYRFNPVADPAMAYFETPALRYLQQHQGHGRTTSLLVRGDIVRDAMPANTTMVFRLRDVHGSDSLFWGRYLRFMNATGSARNPWPLPGSGVADLLAVRQVLVEEPVRAPGWELVLNDRGARVYRNSAALERAFAAQPGRPETTGLREVAAAGFDPRADVLPGSEVRFLRDDPDCVAFRLRVPRAASAVLADPFYPGWHVRVDGRPARGRLAYFLFRSVPVEAGEHVVEWRFEPASFRAGLFLSLLGLAVAAGWLISARRRP